MMTAELSEPGSPRRRRGGGFGDAMSVAQPALDDVDEDGLQGQIARLKRLTLPTIEELQALRSSDSPHLRTQAATVCLQIEDWAREAVSLLRNMAFDRETEGGESGQGGREERASRIGNASAQQSRNGAVNPDDGDDSEGDDEDEDDIGWMLSGDISLAHVHRDVTNFIEIYEAFQALLAHMDSIGALDAPLRADSTRLQATWQHAVSLLELLERRVAVAVDWKDCMSTLEAIKGELEGCATRIFEQEEKRQAMRERFDAETATLDADVLEALVQDVPEGENTGTPDKRAPEGPLSTWNAETTGVLAHVRSRLDPISISLNMFRHRMMLFEERTRDLYPHAVHTLQRVFDACSTRCERVTRDFADLCAGLRADKWHAVFERGTRHVTEALDALDAGLHDVHTNRTRYQAFVLEREARELVIARILTLIRRGIRERHLAERRMMQQYDAILRRQAAFRLAHETYLKKSSNATEEPALVAAAPAATASLLPRPIHPAGATSPSRLPVPASRSASRQGAQSRQGVFSPQRSVSRQDALSPQRGLSRQGAHAARPSMPSPQGLVPLGASPQGFRSPSRLPRPQAHLTPRRAVSHPESSRTANTPEPLAALRAPRLSLDGVGGAREQTASPLKQRGLRTSGIPVPSGGAGARSTAVADEAAAESPVLASFLPRPPVTPSTVSARSMAMKAMPPPSTRGRHARVSEPLAAASPAARNGIPTGVRTPRAVSAYVPGPRRLTYD